MCKTLGRTSWALVTAGSLGWLSLAEAQTPIAQPEYGNYAYASNPSTSISLGEGAARLEEIKVELAWLANPVTFSYVLAAHVQGGNLEVRGYVPNESVRDYALDVAKKESNLSVVNQFKIHHGLAMRFVGEPIASLHQAARENLIELLGGEAQPLQIRVRPGGQITITGSISSYEDKLAVSRRMRRVRGCTSVVNQIQVTSQFQNGRRYANISADGKHVLIDETPAHNTLPEPRPVTLSPLPQGQYSPPGKPPSMNSTWYNTAVPKHEVPAPSQPLPAPAIATPAPSSHATPLSPSPRTLPMPSSGGTSTPPRPPVPANTSPKPPATMPDTLPPLNGSSSNRALNPTAQAQNSIVTPPMAPASSSGSPRLPVIVSGSSMPANRPNSGTAADPGLINKVKGVFSPEKKQPASGNPYVSSGEIILPSIDVDPKPKPATGPVAQKLKHTMETIPGVKVRNVQIFQVGQNRLEIRATVSSAEAANWVWSKIYYMPELTPYTINFDPIIQP